MAKITFEDKEALVQNPDIADKYQCKASDLNQIKQAVNTNDDKFLTNGLNVGTSVDSDYKVNFLKGKNLFDYSTLKNGIILNNSGVETSNSDWATSPYIEVKSSTEYTYSYATTNPQSIMGLLTEYDSSKTFIRQTVINADTQTLTTSSTTKYVRLCKRLDINMTNIQFELGTATTYEPYIRTINVDGDEIYNSNVMNYSTSEQRIGTWIDGKSLYRKVIKTSNVTTDLTNLNVSEWIDIRIMALMSNGVILNIGRAESSSDYFSYYIYDNNKSININVGNTWTLSKATITLLYTKTTD